MGRKIKRFRRNKEPKPRNEQKKGYDDIDRNNEKFETYYKQQNIVNESEWQLFMDTLRENLPAAFRINSCCFNQTIALRDIILNMNLNADEDNDSNGNEIVEIEKRKINCLPWYPKQLAFQFDMSRVEIRKSRQLRKLHSFLISEAESGYISRQEAVSMIPPLLLDVQSGHFVLDVCAAPGSKTAQIIEMLHNASSSTDSKVNNDPGVVIANDVDNERCYMLVHQSKRLNSPTCVVVNHDAGNIPNFCVKNANGEQEQQKFDRILCDVPCSGDGTIRKNYDVWVKWSPANGNNFHSNQLRIVKRALMLLKTDGLLVYSTCSLNPMEDEAVIATILSFAAGSVELVDVSEKLIGLKYINGLEKWSVMQKNLKLVNSFDEVDQVYRTQIKATMFPPKNVQELNLKRCIRILPHLQNTGGFFVAVLRKIDNVPWQAMKLDLDNKVEVKKDSETKPDDNGKEKSNRRRGPRNVFKEDPFFFYQENDEDWLKIKKFYHITDDFPAAQLMFRSNSGRPRKIYFMSKAAKAIIQASSNIKFINGGVRLFEKIDEKVCDCGYRITQEGLSILYPYLKDDYVIEISKSEMENLLSNESIQNDTLEQETQAKLAKIPSGCCVLVYKKLLNTLNNETKEMIVPLCGWKGKDTLRAYIARNEKIHFLRISGVDTTFLEQEEMEKFEAKQERKKQRMQKYDEKQEQADEVDESKEKDNQ